jgi:hypothetical protein
MGHVYLPRKGGGGGAQTLAPSILDFSTVSATEIKFKLRNNDAETATLVYRFSSVTGDGESISLATNTTSSEITLTGLTLPGTLFVTANATGKVKSNVVEQLFEFLYTAATGGTTTEYNASGKRFKSHTFTSDGDFIVTTAGNGDRNQLDYLIIAGGAGGGGTQGGGGGAGGYLTTLGATAGNVANQTTITVQAQTYAINIGSGGSGGNQLNNGFNGTNTSALGITSTGGGFGGGLGDSTSVGGNGGSGGGGASDTAALGGTGISGQGNNGGNGSNGSRKAGGGGGGAATAGGNASINLGGTGGNGLSNLLRIGLNETRAGGGGGGVQRDTATAGLGGTGGGGDGAVTGDGSNATANTGSGGGGGSSFNVNSGGNGADGIVIIRYEIAPSA